MSEEVVLPIVPRESTEQWHTWRAFPYIPLTQHMPELPSNMETIRELLEKPVVSAELIEHPIKRTYRGQLCMVPRCMHLGMYTNSRGVHACGQHKTKDMCLYPRYSCSISGCKQRYSHRIIKPDGSFVRYCKSHAPEKSIHRGISSVMKCTHPECTRKGVYWGGKPGYRCGDHQLETDGQCPSRYRCSQCARPGYFCAINNPYIFRCKVHQYAGDIPMMKRYAQIFKYRGYVKSEPFKS